MSNNAYKVMMKRLFDAQTNFHSYWDSWLRRGQCGEEPLELSEARKEFLQAENELWEKLLFPLQEKFAGDPASAVDDVIDFIEVDIPAFRCGYVKERFLRRLKSVQLTEGQQSRLRNIAVTMCKKGRLTREFRYWVRLMNLLANSDFVSELREIALTDSERSRYAANIMLKSIASQRTDLFIEERTSPVDQ